MLTNDSANLLTLCPALGLACQSCGCHANRISVAWVAIAIVLSLARLWLLHH